MKYLCNDVFIDKYDSNENVSCEDEKDGRKQDEIAQMVVEENSPFQNSGEET